MYSFSMWSILFFQNFWFLRFDIFDTSRLTEFSPHFFYFLYFSLFFRFLINFFSPPFSSFISPLFHFSIYHLKSLRSSYPLQFIALEAITKLRFTYTTTAWLIFQWFYRFLKIFNFLINFFNLRMISKSDNINIIFWVTNILYYYLTTQIRIIITEESVLEKLLNPW